MVWHHKKSGEFYWSSDSGCSCHSPFEIENSLDRLDGHGNRWDAIGALKEEDKLRVGGFGYGEQVQVEVADLCYKISRYGKED